MSVSIHDVIDLRYTGDFSLAVSASLAASAAFIEAPTSGDGSSGDTALDLALLLEGSWNTVAVRVFEMDGAVRATVLANPSGAMTRDIRAQLERILSLDIDAVGFREVAARDDVIARLERRRPGLRPILFPSPYEAAARAIIGHRLPVKQAAAINVRIAALYGVHVDVGDRVMHAFPAPEKLVDLATVPGLAERKVDQLRALGAAAVAGRLNTAPLRAMDREEALLSLQQLPGIGPFSAELIMIRGVGDVDAFPRSEMRLHRAMAAAYHLGDDPDIAALERVAQKWHPYRSWAGLLLRHSLGDVAAHSSSLPVANAAAKNKAHTDARSVALNRSNRNGGNSHMSDQSKTVRSRAASHSKELS